VASLEPSVLSSLQFDEIPTFDPLPTSAMSGILYDLPSFDRPPVIETVLGVFFRPLKTLNSVRQGIYWNDVLSGDFPEFELRPPVEETTERFNGDFGVLQAGVRWQVSNDPDTPRLWAKSPSDEHILQVQRNAFLANWLRRSQYYVCFDDRLHDFQRRLNQFIDHFGEELAFSSCTVTYINQVPVDDKEAWEDAVTRVLSSWSRPATGWLPPMEGGRFQFSFAFPKQSGRLHVAVIPARAKQDDRLLVQLELTARSMLTISSTSDDVASGLRAVHEWVVRGFTALTRPEMHQAWGRTK
jgi:uncharacterized protein (TIGR04255 family)